jgi:two-component system cell cycle sensor histidine kinase/response regulator CckA
LNSCTEVDGVIQESETVSLAGIGCAVVAEAMDAEETTGVVSDEAASSGVAETILLVEDEAFVRKVAAEVLRSAGYRLVIARSAAEALEAYRKCSEPVDLLLADIVMPGMSGRELATEFNRLNPRTRVLLMSGYGQQLAGAELSPHGQYLAKPFSTHLLLSRVREALDAAPFDSRA